MVQHFDPDKRSELMCAIPMWLDMTSPVSENRDSIDQFKLKVVEALCKCEAAFPVTEMAVMFHIITHVPDAIYRWNSIRNFWSFFGER